MDTVPFSLPDYRDRLLWLGQLRWWAMIGAMGAMGVAIFLDWEFVSAPALAGGVAAVVVVNMLLLFRSRRVGSVVPGELWLHVVTDLAALTWMLAWAGGISNPMTVLYSFHVVLGALLTGRSGALVAISGSVIGLSALVLLEHLGALPVPPLVNPPELLSMGAIATLLAGLSYFALHLSSRLREGQKMARHAQARAEETLSLLTGSLDRLQVGLEVWGENGDREVQSPFAARLRERVRGDRPLEELKEFAVSDEEGERLFDVITLQPGAGDEGRAVLFVDRTEERLVQQRHVMLERLATLGRALQGVAHELNTPLTTMQTLAKDLSAALADVDMPAETREDLEESIGILVDESRRCRSLTQSLLSTAHERGGSPTGQTALEVARRAVRLVGLKAEGGDRVQLDEDSLQIPLRAEADRVMQVLMNLVQNAVKAAEEHGAKAPSSEPWVEIAAEERGQRLRITIADRGPGLPEEVRARLFEPFVTTRAMGEGTGLGLYTSHRIARELGGDLHLYDRPGGGTVALLELPLAREEP